MKETDYSVAPGEFLEEFVDDGDFTVQELAERLSWSVDEVFDFMEGKLAVDNKVANDLERAVSIPAHMWHRYEELFLNDMDRLGLTRESRLQP